MSRVPQRRRMRPDALVAAMWGAGIIGALLCDSPALASGLFIGGILMGFALVSYSPRRDKGPPRCEDCTPKRVCDECQWWRAIK